MAARSIFVLLLTSCLTINYGRTTPIEGQASYVEGLNFKYENGKWICGDVECPGETTGCKLRIKSDENDKKIIYQAFTCLDTLGAGDTIKLTEEKLVEIDVKTYVGAKSAYSLSYNQKGKEMANGIVAPDELEDLKEKFKVLKENVIKTESGGVFTRGL